MVGTTNLSEEDWKKAEDHYKINLLYQDMLKKRQEIDRLAKKGQFKYEYDSDEDITGGTWEHKLRMAEMDATKAWAEALTKQSEGRHHIGDFLPPEELRKFMEKYNAKKNNREPDMSDYKEYKLKEDNIGFQMLQKLGWKEGTGLGAEGRTGIVDPINKASQREINQGLGANSNATPPEEENEYEAYRRRMMLAYRFRPNPLSGQGGRPADMRDFRSSSKSDDMKGESSGASRRRKRSRWGEKVDDPKISTTVPENPSKPTLSTVNRNNPALL
uniref:Uncharacterized protein n=1 Tax=Phlebotomus papatasi TaxID=29031 RepID=A0A1B0DL25_PHLPP